MSTVRTDTKKGRFYSGGIIPPGEKYASVTTILQAIGKPALVAWSANVEREMVIAEAAKLHANCPLEMGSASFALQLQERLGKEKAHTKELEKAGAIGSSIHELIEWSLRAELFQSVGKSPILGDQAQWAYQSFQKWRQRTNLKPIAVEQTVACHCHKIAGTMDLSAWFGKVLTICDWKSGKRVYWEAKLQNAAYRHCYREMGLGDPQKGLVLRLPKIIGDPDFEAVDAGDEAYYFERFLHVKDLWETIQAEDALAKESSESKQTAEAAIQ